MKGLGYGKGYQYAHDLEAGVADMTCFPAGLEGRRYYRPTVRGLEKAIGERLSELRRRREEGNEDEGETGARPKRSEA